jgi:hypothetical protein
MLVNEAGYTCMPEWTLPCFQEPFRVVGRDSIHHVRFRVAPTLGQYTERGMIPEADVMNAVPTDGLVLPATR